VIIVSDTTPLHYLILIRRETILPAIFNEIIIPQSVAKEMAHPKAPKIVQHWIELPPRWVKIRSASPEFLKSIVGLGSGEAGAIAIALEMKASAVLMDDRKAIREARNNGILVLTTLGVLELAYKQQLIDLGTVLNELAGTSFRMPTEEVLEEYLKRNQSSGRNA
jgi:predicted nucleic acid-binding protein